MDGQISGRAVQMVGLISNEDAYSESIRLQQEAARKLEGFPEKLGAEHADTPKLIPEETLKPDSSGLLWTDD